MADPTPTQFVNDWLQAFGGAITRGDYAAVVDMFDADCYWRDMVSFTWNLKTMEGKDAIGAFLAATMPAAKPSNWQVLGDATHADGVHEAWITFETAQARGKGQLRLKAGKAWTLLTTMQELKGFEERKGGSRPKGVEHGAFAERKNWLERKTEEEATLGFKTQPYVVIVGGGQGGIVLGARLKKLGVPAIIVEKNAKPGDS